MSNQYNDENFLKSMQKWQEVKMAYLGQENGTNFKN